MYALDVYKHAYFHCKDGKIIETYNALTQRDIQSFLFRIFFRWRYLL